MEKHIRILIDRMNSNELQKTQVISWGSPIPSFGDFSRSRVATLGLNPSNCEFVDDAGYELEGNERRFHTLSSLGLTRWSDVTPKHIKNIAQLCREYFHRNPYDRWFKKLDYLISGTGFSYYGVSNHACHLDLVPYATTLKWTDLSMTQRRKLISISLDVLGLLLKDSTIEVLILNGRTVVEEFRKETDVDFLESIQPNWTLPRQKGPGVSGTSYKGFLKEIAGVKLKKPLLVLGYNHNIQSSFGVTKEVQNHIRLWLKKNYRNINHAQ